MKLIALINALIGVVTLAKGQVNIPLDPAQDHSYYYSQSGIGLVTYWVYSDGDTLIGGHEYLKMVDTLGGGDFGVRQDLGVVYTHSYNLDTSFVVCDFNMNVGDTIELVAPFGAITPWTLDSISVIMFSGSIARKFNLSQVGTIYRERWIEGFGPVSGFHWNAATPGVNYYHCHYQNGWLLQSNTLSSWDTCDSAMVLSELPELNLELFPNPSSGFSTIDYQSSIKIENLIITDIVGNVVKSVNLNSKEGRASLDLSNQNSGIYFCSLVSGSRILSTIKISVIKWK
ncbi:MAG: hypothetical protein ACI9J3_001462 [Parvicellaceae bacterium]|jgi:hypothetical protein